MEWQITPQENDGYYLRPVTQEEVDGGTIDSVSQPGWYYVLKRDLTFNMVLRDGTISSTEESREALRNKVLDNFRFTAYWSVGNEYKDNVSTLRAMGKYVQITEDNDNLTLTVAGVWKYNLDGSLITYKVDQLPEADGGTTPGVFRWRIWERITSPSPMTTPMCPTSAPLRTPSIRAVPSS